MGLLHRCISWPTVKSIAVSAVQIMAGVHLFTTHVAEVRMTVGSSMVPTLSPSGEMVLCVKLPVYDAVQRLRAQWTPFLEGVSPHPLPLQSSASSQLGPTSDSSRGQASRRLFGRQRMYDEAYDRKTRNPFHLDQGDLVVAISPTNPARAVCKRVLGLPGDTVHSDPRDAQSAHVTVPRGHVWLAGDNLNNSTDSRHYGPVPVALVRGRVVATLIPWKLLGNEFPTYPIPLSSAFSSDSPHDT